MLSCVLHTHPPHCLHTPPPYCSKSTHTPSCSDLSIILNAAMSLSTKISFIHLRAAPCSGLWYSNVQSLEMNHNITWLIRMYTHMFMKFVFLWYPHLVLSSWPRTLFALFCIELPDLASHRWCFGPSFIRDVAMGADRKSKLFMGNDLLLIHMYTVFFLHVHSFTVTLSPARYTCRVFLYCLCIPMLWLIHVRLYSIDIAQHCRWVPIQRQSRWPSRRRRTAKACLKHTSL